MGDPGAGRGRRGRRWLAVLLALVALPIVGVLALRWSAPRRGPPPPRFAATSAAPAPETSTIVAPLALPLRTLAELLDDRLPPTLFTRDEPIAGLTVAIEVTRAGALSLTAEGDQFIAHLPIHITADLATGRKLRSDASAPRVAVGMQLRAAVAPSITPDWRLATRTRLTYRWTSHPTLRVAGRQFDIAGLVDRVLAAQLPKIAAKLDDAIGGRDPLRPQIERAWESLSRPQKLRDAPPVWLVADPEALYVTDPALTGDALALTVGLAGRFQVALGDVAPQTAARPLPARAAAPPAPGFRLHLAAALGWDALSATATEALAGRTWTVSAATLTPGRVTLYPSGERVVFGLDYAADVAGYRTDGTVYFQGRLVLDRAAGVLRVDDFDYLLDTWDDTVAGANALAQSGLREAAQTRLVFRYGDALADARARVTAGLTAASERHGGMFTGTLDRLEPGDVRLTDEAVVIDATLTGQLALRLDPPAPRP